MARLDLDMTEGNIWMHMIRFSVPMAIGLLFQQLYNTVDTLVVGQFVGQQAQAAVGSTGPIINTIVGFCAGLATGASVVISQRYGAHDNEGLSKAVHTTVALTFIVSIIATVFLFCGLLHLASPVYVDPVSAILSGGLMLGAIFMATDYVTSPMTHKGQLIYGVCIGLLTVVIRNWGSYPEGMSFAILIMNAFTPLINTYVKPKRFGEVVKK